MVLISVKIEDPIDPLDGLDLAALQSNIILPVEANINAESLTLELMSEGSEGGGDVTISVNVTTVTELPPGAQLTFLINTFFKMVLDNCQRSFGKERATFWSAAAY